MADHEDYIQECLAELRGLAGRIEAGEVVVTRFGTEHQAVKDRQGRKYKGRETTFEVWFEVRDE